MSYYVINRTANVNAALAPFVPRVVGISYVIDPVGPIVFVTPDPSALVQCAADYPFDPRNQSLEALTTSNTVVTFDNDVLITFDGQEILLF